MLVAREEGGKRGKEALKNDPFPSTFNPTNLVHEIPLSITRRAFLLSLRMRSSSVVDGAPLEEASGTDLPDVGDAGGEGRERGEEGGDTRSLEKSREVRVC